MTPTPALEPVDLLAIGAHPDDVEVGMGGTPCTITASATASASSTSPAASSAARARPSSARGSPRGLRTLDLGPPEHLAEGFVLDRPVPADDLPALLGSR